MKNLRPVPCNCKLAAVCVVVRPWMRWRGNRQKLPVVLRHPPISGGRFPRPGKNWGGLGEAVSVQVKAADRAAAGKEQN